MSDLNEAAGLTDMGFSKRNPFLHAFQAYIFSYLLLG